MAIKYSLEPVTSGAAFGGGEDTFESFHEGIGDLFFPVGHRGSAISPLPIFAPLSFKAFVIALSFGRWILSFPSSDLGISNHISIKSPLFSNISTNFLCLHSWISPTHQLQFTSIGLSAFLIGHSSSSFLHLTFPPAAFLIPPRRRGTLHRPGKNSRWLSPR